MDSRRISEHLVLHLDMNAFFAAIEERDNPQFVGRPIIVGADPKKGVGRGVVSTGNYKAREYGIHSGMPISWAYRACPEGVFLPCDFKRYGSVSRNIFSVIRGYGYPTEQVSVDECYVEMPNCAGFENLAREMKQKIWEVERLTCSVGIGPNKLVSKVASNFKKPDGLTIVLKKDVQRFLDPMSVRVLPGVGPKTAGVLLSMGVITVKDLRQTYLYKLKEQFGKHGAHLWELANGRDDRKVFESHEVKSVGRQTTFWKDTKDPRIIYDTTLGLLRETFEELTGLGIFGKTLTVVVRYAWFETHTSQETSKGLLTFQEARRLGLKLLVPYFNNKLVRLVGVRVSGFGGGGVRSHSPEEGVSGAATSLV